VDNRFSASIYGTYRKGKTRKIKALLVESRKKKNPSKTTIHTSLLISLLSSG
jgi:hypothetical protein